MREFPNVDRRKIDEDVLSASQSEDDFVGAGVSLLVEATSYLTIACSIYKDERGWTRSEAIVGGLGIRLIKLSQAFLDETCKHRREIAEILSRLMFETSVHILYFIENESEYLENSFVDFSLKFERNLLKQIEGRIRDRGGDKLPIEERMIASIEGLATASGVDLSKPPIDKRNWGSKNLYEKAEAIGWGDAYLGVFAGMSNAVHGNWGDIAAHHLARFDGTGFFEGMCDWSPPRPQHLLTLTRIVVSAAQSIFLRLGGAEVADHYSCNHDDLFERANLVTGLHEQFLAKRKG